MVRWGCAESIHGRLSIEEASSFFEKVQLRFQLPDLFVQFVPLRVCLQADLLAAIAENIRQTGQGLFLPASDLCRVDTERLRNLSSCLVSFNGFHRHLRLQTGRVI